MRVRKFRPRRDLILTQATVVSFIGLPLLGRLRWLLFGWRSLGPERNQTMRQAFRAEKQKSDWRYTLPKGAAAKMQFSEQGRAQIEQLRKEQG